jgi:hypothetical protein
MPFIKRIMFRDEPLDVRFTPYMNGGTAIVLTDQEGMPYMTATAWVEGLGEGFVAIKDYSENQGIYQTLVNEKIIEPVTNTVPSGYAVLYRCKLIDPEISGCTVENGEGCYMESFTIGSLKSLDHDTDVPAACQSCKTFGGPR